MSTLLLVATLCLVAGAALGLLGGGGSILAVPVLVFAGGLEPRSAIATSLLVVGVSSAVAAGAHGARGRVDVRAGLTLGLASMLGAYAGGRVGQLVPSTVLLAAFTAVMAVTALAMMRRRAEPTAGLPPASWIRTAAVGLAVGALTGLVGAGGGFIIVPALVLLCGLPMRRAIGTSLLVISLNSVAGFAGAASSTPIDLTLAAAATAAATLGSLAGVLASARVPVGMLRVGFAWLVLAISFFMILQQLPAGVFQGLKASASHLIAGLVGAALVAVAWLAFHLRQSLGRSSTSPSTSRSMS